VDADYFRLLFDYNRWANGRVLERCADLPPGALSRPAALSMGSIRGVLAHQLGTEVLWLARCRGQSPATILMEHDFPDLPSLVSRWRRQDADQAAFLSTLTDDDVNGKVSYRTMRGEPFSQALGHMLAHVVNHGTQCRSEAAVALTSLGRSPGDIDFILYLRGRGM
jgi:uncharacterized damage-inducible protein DinB